MNEIEADRGAAFEVQIGPRVHVVTFSIDPTIWFQNMPHGDSLTSAPGTRTFSIPRSALGSIPDVLTLEGRHNEREQRPELARRSAPLGGAVDAARRQTAAESG